MRSPQILCLTLLSVASSLRGQADTGRLQGTIADTSGAAVSGANVSITNTATGFAQSTSTNELGYYAVSALLPGHYRVEVTMQGFKKVVRELDLQVAQIAVADFTLDVGEVTQSVTVDAGSPVIDPADSAIGEVVESRQVTELPLNGRNFTQLATLVPGVTRGIPTGANSATGANNNAETFRFGQEGGASLNQRGSPTLRRLRVMKRIINSKHYSLTVCACRRPPSPAGPIFIGVELCRV